MRLERFVDMASTTNELPRVDLQPQPTRDKPSPLRIVKRHGSTGAIAATRASSSNTDGSAHEPVSRGDHLTVMKRRSERYRLNVSPADETKHSPESTAARDISAGDRPKCSSWDDFMFLGNGLAGSKTLNIPKTRTSRPALEEARGFGAQTHRSASLRCVRLGKTSVVPYAPNVSPMSSQSGVAGQSCHDNRSQSSLSGMYPHILDAPARQPSPALSMHNGSLSKSSCVLCPHVSVTTECTALEADQQSV